MTISRYTPRSLTANVRNLGDGRQNFLMNTIFVAGRKHKSKLIDFGSLNINAAIVSYSRPGEPAGPVNKTLGEAKTIMAPKIRKKIVFDENYAETLDPSLDSYAGVNTDPNAQMAEKIAKEQMDLRLKIDRTVEVQCAQAIQTGTITVTYADGSTATISLGFTGDGATAGDALNVQLALAGTSKWGSTAAKPIKDIEAWVGQIRDNSSWSGAIDALVGSSAWAAMLDNDQVLKLLDNKGINVGNLAPVAGALYKGMLNGVRIWQYSNGYVASATRVQAWDPTKIALVPANSGLLTIEYGPVFDFPDANSEMAQFIPTDYYSRFNKQTDPAVTELIVESNPLALIRDPKAIRVCKVC